MPYASDNTDQKKPYSGIRHSTLYTTIAVLLVLYCCYLFTRYLAYPGYMAHSGANITIHAWRLVTGQELYLAREAENYLFMHYGPVLFLWNGLFMALFGGSILSSKIAGVFSMLMGVGVFGAYVWRRYGYSYVGFGVVIFVCIQSFAVPFYFFNRPDPLLVLLVTIALFSTTLQSKTAHNYISPVFIAICLGLAVNLKAHAFLYFAPIVFVYCSDRWRISYSLIIALSLVIFALPFFSSLISISNYLDGVSSVVGAHEFLMDSMITSLKKSPLYLSPLIIAGIVFLVRKQHLPMRSLMYSGLLFLTITIVLYPASISGASWYHFMPMVSVTVDVILRLIKDLDKYSKIQTSIAALFAVFYLITIITPQKRLNLFFTERMYMSEVKAEVKTIMATHSGDSIQMGYGDTSTTNSYEKTYLKPVLMFAGNPIAIDAYSDMETSLANVPISQKKLEHLETCKTDHWLIPTGEVPFELNSYFGGKIYSLDFQNSFLANYRLAETHKYFDVWSNNCWEF
jgi:hypothetical protein